VVNDDSGGCELVARIFEANGLEARRIHEHGEALLALSKEAGSLDAVILDFTSGGTSTSLKLLDSIRHGDEASRTLPVLILSASANNRLFAYQSGVDAFLVRPFHADELVAAVRAVLARSVEEREAYREAQLEDARSA
jgi:two-component system response regulator MprA